MAKSRHSKREKHPGQKIKQAASLTQESSKKVGFFSFLKTPLGTASAIFVLAFLALFLYFGLSGFFSSQKASPGDTVNVNYVGRFVDGELFDTNVEDAAKEAGIYDSSRIYSPMTFVLSAGSVIEGFDKAVLGMRTGEKKTVTIPPSEAYGEPNPAMVQNVTVPKSISLGIADLEAKGLNNTLGSIVYTLYGPAVLSDINSTEARFTLEPVIGERLYFPSGISATVLSVSNSTENPESLVLSLDTNHPLAGKTLVFEITLVSFEKKNA